MGAPSFALAIVLNFAPGVAPATSRRSYFEENFKRDRAREQTRKAGVEHVLGVGFGVPLKRRPVEEPSMHCELIA